MSHHELLRGKEETLLRIIHPNVLVLALLAEQDWLDECTEQAIAAERTNFDRNRRLLDWLRQSPREAFDGFLRALRANGQAHVANYIDGTPGELTVLLGHDAFAAVNAATVASKMTIAAVNEACLHRR